MFLQELNDHENIIRCVHCANTQLTAPARYAQRQSAPTRQLIGRLRRRALRSRCRLVLTSWRARVCPQPAQRAQG